MTKRKRFKPSHNSRRGKSRLPLYSLVGALAAIAGFLSVTLVDRFGAEQAVAGMPAGQQETSATVAENSNGLDKLVRSAEPKPLPDFKFSDGAGGEHHLSEWKGKVLLVNLWATWCAPCKREMPSLNRLQTKLEGADFTVLPISLDRTGPDKPRQYLTANKLDKLNLFLDSGSDLIGTLDAPGLPLSVIVDRNGREIARIAGPAEWDSPEAEKIIQDAIASKG
jgi:thiol-disulfide isomerase/thioredoxin